MSLHKIAIALNDWWDVRGEHVAFVAEDTLISIYSGGAFIGVLHWRMQPTEPLTMVINFVKTDGLDDIRDSIRLFLKRTLSAFLPHNVCITGLVKK
jgi:hypothetical protein